MFQKKKRAYVFRLDGPSSAASVEHGDNREDEERGTTWASNDSWPIMPGPTFGNYLKFYLRDLN